MGHLVGNFGSGSEDATETGVLVAGSTVDSSGVYSRPGGVVAVSVFDGMDGIVAALVDVAVVAVDIAVVKGFGAGLDNSIVGETCGIGTVAAEAIC